MLTLSHLPACLTQTSRIFPHFTSLCLPTTRNEHAVVGRMIDGEGGGEGEINRWRGRIMPLGKPSEMKRTKALYFTRGGAPFKLAYAYLPTHMPRFFFFFAPPSPFSVMLVPYCF
jgi:hypothetical protein